MSRRPRDSDPQRERAILAAAMLHGARALDEAEVRAEDFDDPRHRVVFEVMDGLRAAGRHLDTVEVYEQLRARGEHKIVGDIEGLADLVDLSNLGAARHGHVAQHGARLRELTRARQVRDGLRQIAEVESPDEMVELAQVRLPELLDGRVDGARPIDEIVNAALGMTSAAARGELRLAKTGLVDLDRVMCGGMRPQDLVVVGGRPSMGKTALVVAWAAHSVRAGQPVYLASLEMSGEEIVHRLQARLALVDFEKVRTGNLREAEARRIHEAARLIAASPVVIDDTVVRLSDLCARVRRWRRRHPDALAWAAVDHLGHVAYDGGDADNREQQIAGISRGLKRLARECKMPVVLLAQLNRGVETRSEKRPVLADLRESGAVEQDADVVIFPFREEYYRETIENRGRAELIVAKQRNGPTPTVVCVYQKETVSFFDRHGGPAP